MSDANTAGRLNLDDALRRLPLVAPDEDGWPALAAQLAPRPRARRHLAVPLALALAATLVLAAVTAYRVLLPRDTHTADAHLATVAGSPASIPVNATTHTNAQGKEAMQLAQLQAHSQSLERWLRRTGSTGLPLQGQDLAAATEIENLIGVIDVELTVPAQTHAVALWRRRVSLLEDLAALRYSNYQLAAGGAHLAANSRID